MGIEIEGEVPSWGPGIGNGDSEWLESFGRPLESGVAFTGKTGSSTELKEQDKICFRNVVHGIKS